MEIPEFKWETKSTIMRSVSADLFLDTIGNLFLEQLVNEPTRIRNEQTSSLLDLVLTNNIYFVDEISVQDPIGKSDHVVLDIFVIANTGKVIPILRGHCHNMNHFLRTQYRQQL